MNSQHKIPEEVPETELLKNSPAYFINTLFGYQIDAPHRNILQHYEQAQETLDLGPRGCGKTRIGNIGYSSWQAVNNPDIRILIVSDTDRHAIRFLGTTKTVIESHPLIRQYYGNLKGDTWTDHEIVLKTRTDKTLMEATISAMGIYSGAVTTGHYNIVIADDLINFDNSRTEGQRERSKEWFKTTLLPTILPGGEIHCLGTRYHYKDLWDCVQNELGYDTQTQCAIVNEGLENEHSLWERHMPLHTKINAANGKKTKGLVEIRDGDENSGGIGSLIFNLQYQNNVELMKKGKIFLYDWFQFYESIPVDLKIFQGADLAISKKETADFFVIITVGIDRNMNVYILDIFREQGISFNTQMKTITKKAKEWDPIRIGVEANAYQEALSQELIRTTNLPIRPLTTIRDKVTRAQKRSGIVENGKVFIRKDMHLFINELVLFPDASHDDQFDAFDFALKVAFDTEKPTPSSHIPPLISPMGPGVKI